MGSPKGLFPARKFVVLIVLLCFGFQYCFGQQDNAITFRNTQLSSKRVVDAIKKYDDSGAREFRRKNMDYPPKDIYLRVFKLQNEMELWARNDVNSEYRFIKLFRVCAISGALGPKRTQGDRQVPEGFYFIDDFNPQSDYYLSMQLNYPNYSDSMLGKGKLGGDIFIHGGCVTIGCLPMTDEGIKELYVICLNARLNGQEDIPVHVYPTRLTQSGVAYLKREYPRDQARQQFWAEMKNSFDYFEKTHRLLPVMFRPDGKYAY